MNCVAFAARCSPARLLLPISKVGPPRRPVPRKRIFERLIGEFQPGEKNLYEKGVNVLIVRRVAQLPHPFPVGQLTVRSINAPHGERATAGGWSFVLPNPKGMTLPLVGESPQHKGSKASALDTIPKAEDL